MLSSPRYALAAHDEQQRMLRDCTEADLIVFR